MQLSPTLEAAYNAQIRLELQSSIAYLQMGADFESRNLTGFAHWMRLQSNEEWGHAMKFIGFVLDRGGHVQLGDLPAPSPTPETAVATFEMALAHEQRVSHAINELYAQAIAEHDFASLPLLQWFVNEQVEEESLVSTTTERLRMISEDPTGLLFLDTELGGRQPEPEGADAT